MRPPADRHNMRPLDLNRALERLEALPIRPMTARTIVDVVPEPAGDGQPVDSPRFLETDPGWVSSGASLDQPETALAVVASRSWWQASNPEASDALERLWKHSVATASSARRLATEAGRPDPDRFARAGLLQTLGLWAVAAIDSTVLAELLAIRNPSRRAEFERDRLGQDSSAWGRDLAERWGLDSLTVASCWFHADRNNDLSLLCDDPEGLALLQNAYHWAEKTPWAIGSEKIPEPGATDARLRILTAEVQVRCGAGLLEPDATEREEVVTRRLAAVRVRHERLSGEVATRDRLLRTIASSPPAESLASWAERAALEFCQEPGVASAKVIWGHEDSEFRTVRPPTRIVPLGRSSAEVHLWTESESSDVQERLASVLPAWSAWAESLAERSRRGARLDQVVSTHRIRVDRDAEADRTSRLSALAEFAAGSGHELNNPLAVILGRAQLLLPKVEEPEDIRALRVIIGQAQRAHRILRDLIYIARPPVPRARLCRPDDLIRNAIRDLKPDAEARGVTLISETREPVPVAWADPEPLRHAVDVLLRNALEATPTGGKIRITSGRSGDRLNLVVKDLGRGITAEEGAHLFDPFFCGRQAGRGLGLGLPRVARFLNQVGGDLTWKSNPGQGSSFAMNLPLQLPPS